MVAPQQPAQPLAAIHEGAPDGAGLGCDQHVAEPLMIPLPVVARDELVEGAEQATLPEHDQAVETLVPVRNLIGARVTSWRRSVQTSGPPVSTTGRLGSGRTRRRICEGATLSLLERALPSGGLRERARRGRPQPRSGDALVAVMEPADRGR
jgi:hypothetical protein